MNKRPALWILALMAALILASCGGYAKIGRITADPSRYRNRTVHVEGQVTNAFGTLSTGGYQLEDGTGKIVIISNQGIPSKGSKVAVSGRVMEGITVMGKTFGTAIQEHDHHVR
jgi:hypothetical protein